jgi:mannan endo-1,6-alpha-mannosidase
MVSFYSGNQSGQIPGLLPPADAKNQNGYYWWEAGAMFGALINYWYFTGDTTYNAITTQAILFQRGDDSDFKPQNQTKSLGNDDQAFWAMTALTAAEYKFPDPPHGGPSWLGLAQAVFNEQTSVWDTKFCNGGLRWQIPLTNPGYDLKNSISNGCLFAIAARLGRYTKDPSYAEWSDKIWDWMWRIGLISPTYQVFDNSEADKLNCTELDKNQWSYNAGVMILGSGVMYNFVRPFLPSKLHILTYSQTGDVKWQDRTEKLLATLSRNFFVNGTMREGCENPVGTQQGCNQDQKSFKAYLSRWLTITSQMVPSTAANITALLRSSAKSAARQCVGGPRGTSCGIQWDKDGRWDGTTGVGQEMSALEVILGTMIGLPGEYGPKPPVTGDTGGTSVSVPTAGNPVAAATVVPASKGSQIAAWFITVLIALICLFMIYFMWTDAFESGGSTLAGVSAKGKGTDPEKRLDPDRTIIDLNSGKRRSMGNMDGIMAGEKHQGDAVHQVGLTSPIARGSVVSVLPRVEEGGVEEPQPTMGKGMGHTDRASLPRWRGGDWVT